MSAPCESCKGWSSTFWDWGGRLIAWFDLGGFNFLLYASFRRESGNIWSVDPWSTAVSALIIDWLSLEDRRKMNLINNRSMRRNKGQHSLDDGWWPRFALKRIRWYFWRTLVVNNNELMRTHTCTLACARTLQDISMRCVSRASMFSSRTFQTSSRHANAWGQRSLATVNGYRRVQTVQRPPVPWFSRFHGFRGYRCFWSSGSGTRGNVPLS